MFIFYSIHWLVAQEEGVCSTVPDTAVLLQEGLPALGTVVLLLEELLGTAVLLQEALCTPLEPEPEPPQELVQSQDTALLPWCCTPPHTGVHSP